MDIRIKRLAENLKKYAGETVTEKVMAECEQITVLLSPAKKARWVKNAMERLESCLDEAARINIMESCSCETESKIKQGKLIYRKSKNMDDFLVELEKARIVGTKIERVENIIYVYYDRCYCPLVKSTKEKISLTY